MLKAVILVGGPQKGNEFVFTIHNHNQSDRTIRFNCLLDFVLCTIFMHRNRYTIPAVVIGFAKAIVSGGRPFNYPTSYRGVCAIERSQRDSGDRLLSVVANGKICDRHAEFVQRQHSVRVKLLINI